MKRFNLLLCAPLLFAHFAHADTSQENEIELIKQQLLELQKRLAELEAKAKQQGATNKNNMSESPEVLQPKKREDGSIKLYATLRPTYGYIEDQNDEFMDIQDALSHAGFKSTYQFKPGWQAIAHGEWSIDLGNNGDFGKARQVYVALDSPIGQFGLGKQRPVQYTLIAEYVDIFNHRSSPFAYDVESPFFVNNLVTYENQISDFKFMIGGQFDGDSGDDFADFINTGLGYSRNGLHLALTYSRQNDYNQQQLKIGKTEVVAGMAALDISDNLYAAIAYQDVDYQRVNSRSGATLDVSLAYRFHPLYRAKLGFFDFDDGNSKLETKSHQGANLTFEWLPSDNLRFHLEYLTKDFDALNDTQSISVGFRYDYSQQWAY
ncbi:porin [Pseudoalteromonas sp. XMcav1-K]|uniref:porin n=1 Tax=Pseudoalteromonas sp. XMcav1-K TaxID=3374372 RepID=UPI003756E51A